MERSSAPPTDMSAAIVLCSLGSTRGEREALTRTRTTIKEALEKEKINRCARTLLEMKVPRPKHQDRIWVQWPLSNGDSGTFYGAVEGGSKKVRDGFFVRFRCDTGDDYKIVLKLGTYTSEWGYM